MKLRPAILVASILAVPLAGCSVEQLSRYEPAPAPPATVVSGPAAESKASTTRPFAVRRATGPRAGAAATMPVASDAPATQPVDAPEAAPVTLPYTIERFERPTDGPVTMRGVVARIDLTDPRVRVRVLLADPRDPDGDGKAVGRLETVSHAVEQQRLTVGINASFFGISGSRTILGKRVGYFVGNGGWPSGFHFAEGRLVGQPEKDALRATMIVHRDRRVSLEANVRELPDDAAYAVSGSAKVLSDGIATVSGTDLVRHPRSAVGLTPDNRTLLLVALDGRRPGWSEGATLGELATVMKSLGASDAINLDGGGSTALVVRDAVTGAVGVANRPSGKAPLSPALDSVERPVIDLIGVDVADE